MELPEATSPEGTSLEAALTGNDVTGSDVSHVTGSMFCACATSTFCTTTIVVVKNVVQ